VISNSYKVSQDALSVVRAFRILRNQNFFKDIEYFKDKKKEFSESEFNVIVGSILETVF